MNPWTVKRIYDTQMQCVEDAFTLSELMGKLAQEIWSELHQPPAGGPYSDAEPFISSFRRGLQRQHLRLLVNIALQDPDGTLPADAHALTTMTLQDLNETLGEALKKDRGKTLDSFTRAHLMPRTTSNWSSPIASGRRGAGASSATDTMIASRQRVHQALDAVGPEFSGLLLDVCCFLKRLEELESERGWPARSAKVVLQLALDRLARHYGFAAQTKGQARAEIRTWLADGAAFSVDSV